MYTQCPDCSTAFRVTADVLKQAAGKVRCGGCGNAFNALLYLTESLPEQSAPTGADEALPELKPEAPPGDGLPASISAEQSAALLKTLDELAGSDIQIEDTGVEWRVLDEEEIGNAAGDEPVIDEFLDESPTPVDQFLTETPAVVDSPEIFEASPPELSRRSVDEIRFDDNTPLPDDFDLGDDGFGEGAFAAAVSPGEPVEEDAEEFIDEVPQIDLDLSEPDEWTDILGEFEELAEAVAAPVDDEQALASESEPKPEPEVDLDTDIEAELEAIEIPAGAEEEDEPLDMDSQFALQAEAMGIDLSGVHETVEAENAVEGDAEVDLDELLRESKEEDLELEDLLDEDLVDECDEQELEALSDDDKQLDLIEDGVVEEEPREELEDDAGGYHVPPMTEEEQTINMQIDQDLLALAVEDEDGFASTIIIPDDDAQTRATIDSEGLEDAVAEEALKESGAGFETIIMEGEAFRSTEDIEKLEADTAAAAVLAGAAAADREAENAPAEGGRRYGFIAGIVALLLLLGVQYVHQSREALATVPAFNKALGPLYRSIGQPLAPAWDITGWRFEVAKGTEEGDESLTIYSRLGNKSENPLPYPLIGVSLTDRFEETIGSRVLDPADYLSHDTDPRELVQPGNTIEAVITIQSPAEATAGFRLRACYRTTDGMLRCKDDGFK